MKPHMRWCSFIGVHFVVMIGVKPRCFLSYFLAFALIEFKEA